MIENLSKISAHQYLPHTLPICISTDDNYAKYTIVLLQSIMVNASNAGNYLLVILDCGISESSKTDILQQVNRKSNFKVVFIDLSNTLQENRHLFAETNLISIATYGRLFIPMILQDFERAIYLDVDMIVNLDIAELGYVDLQDNYIAAVIDSTIEEKRYLIWLDDRDLNDYCQRKLALSSANYYINAGLVVFNLNQWRANNLFMRCIESLTKLGRLIWNDQDILNYVCKDHIHYLPQKYNCLCFDSPIRETARYQKEISQHQFLRDLIDEHSKAYHSKDSLFHFVGGLKPWYFPESNRNNIFWWRHCFDSDIYLNILFSLLQRPVAQLENTSRVMYFCGIPFLKVIRSMESTVVKFIGIPLLRIKKQFNGNKMAVYICGLRLFAIKDC